MIIRTTFNDNDYTDYLEEYWNDFMFKNYYAEVDLYKHKDDYDSLLKYRNLYIEYHDLLDKIILDKKDITEEDLKHFKDLIKRSIIAFIKYECLDSIKYLEDNLKIDIVNKVDDTWENREVIYYFLETKQMIIL